MLTIMVTITGRYMCISRIYFDNNGRSICCDSSYCDNNDNNGDVYLQR